MNDYITVDALWARLLDFASNPMYKEQKDLEIIEISDTEVAITGAGGVEPPRGATSVKWDKEKGILTSTTKRGGKVMDVVTNVIHEEPLRVEAWRVDAEGTRVASKMFAKMTSFMFDEMIAKHESASSWFG
mmetsp:Transcript_116969/g.364158  ORF Transcript_116969/g.364158 Transcript_116969/m.364158 type:complete len:131 (+) Transcript_116969:446-838(+)